MKIISLNDADYNRKHYVNANNILRWYGFRERGKLLFTVVILMVGDSLEVSETPEEIKFLIEE